MFYELQYDWYYEYLCIWGKINPSDDERDTKICALL